MALWLGLSALPLPGAVGLILVKKTKILQPHSMGRNKTTRTMVNATTFPHHLQPHAWASVHLCSSRVLFLCVVIKASIYNLLVASHYILGIKYESLPVTCLVLTIYHLYILSFIFTLL